MKPSFRMRTLHCCGLTALLLMTGLLRPAYGQPTSPPPPEIIGDNLKLARQADEENATRYKGNADVLVLPGLVADRRQKIVRIVAQATALKETDPVEFFLIPWTSPKGYEALAIAFAKPSDVHQALEFIGMKPGHPVDFGALQYWPKGERVIMTFEWAQPANTAAGDPAAIPGPNPGPNPGANPGPNPGAQPANVRVENLLINTNTRQPLPETGLVFCGSYWGESSVEPPKKLYAADFSESKSIASNYNEPSTVLDLPRQSFQTNVYATQTPNPAYRFAPRQMIQVVLRPEHPDGTLRVRDLELTVAPPAAATMPAIKDLQFTLRGSPGPQAATQKVNADGDTLPHILAALGKMVDAGQDPFVTLSFDPRLPIQTVAQVAALLKAADSEQGMRVEAPPDGQLYYRAFLPSEKLRDPANRMGQPWELHLTYQAGKVTGTLRELRENWEVPNPPRIEPIDTPAPDSRALAAALARLDPKRPRGIMIFAPAELPYGALVEFLKPSLPTHNQLFVFLNEK